MKRSFRLFAMLLGSLLASAAAFALPPENVALNKPVTAISPGTVGGAYGPPESVNDGTTATVWYTYQGGSYNTNSFSIDLGGQYNITSVEMYVSQVQGFTLSSSINGLDWTPRAVVDLGVLAYYGEVPALAGGYTARYLKYEGYANWNQYVGMNEFRVFASAAPPPTPRAEAIPTLSQWTSLLLGALLLATGWVRVRRR